MHIACLVLWVLYPAGTASVLWLWGKTHGELTPSTVNTSSWLGRRFKPEAAVYWFLLKANRCSGLKVVKKKKENLGSAN
jgi:hypothetical protein